MKLRNDRPHVISKADGDGGETAADVNGKNHPSVQKTDQFAVSFSQIHILSTRVGKHRPEFRNGNRSEPGNNHASEPSPNKNDGDTGGGRYLVGRQENTCS